MAEFEKDFVVRQAKDLAKSLGGFLTQDTVDEILQTNEQDKHQQQLNSFIENEIKKFEEEDIEIEEEEDKWGNSNRNSKIKK